MKIEIKKYLGLGVVAFFTWLCVHYWPKLTGIFSAIVSAAQPLIFGAIIAYVVGILMGCYERIWFPKSNKLLINKTRPTVCMLLAFITIIAVVIFLIKLVVPQLIACVQLLLKELPPAIDSLIAYLRSQEEVWPALQGWISGENFNREALLQKAAAYLTSGATGIMSGAVNTSISIISAIPDVVFTLIFAMYMLLGKHTLLNQAKRLLKAYVKPGIREKVNYVASVANDSFRSFVIGQVTEALLIGALCTAGMLLLRLPYATMTGAVVGFTALIPIVGAYIGAFVGAFIIFTVSPMQALIFVIYLLILQQIEGNLIYPHTVGSSIGLPGMWVLAAVTICGGLFGIPGMLIGVPIMATAYRLLSADIHRREGDIETTE